MRSSDYVIKVFEQRRDICTHAIDALDATVDAGLSKTEFEQMCEAVRTLSLHRLAIDQVLAHYRADTKLQKAKRNERKKTK